VNTERFEKWLAAGESASWLIGEADITLRINLYSPIVSHLFSFVKRTKAKRLPQVTAF
jgi:hypothetical protein